MNTRSLLVSAVALAALPTSHALACSPQSCFDTGVFPASGTMPANMVQLLFTSGGSYSSSIDGGYAEPRLYRLEGAAKVSLSYSSMVSERSVLITPIESQPAGARLVLEADPAGCLRDPFHAEFTVSEPVALPTELGTLDAQIKREVVEVSVVNGSCSGLVDAAYADLTVLLSEAAKPYAELWRHQLFVDGRPAAVFSSSLAGGVRPPQGHARIYAVCDKESWINVGGGDLSPATHRVHLTSSLPDGTSLTTPAIDVDLSCGSTPPRWPPDASAPRARDAAVSMAGPDANVRGDDVIKEDVEKDGEGCALAPRGGGAWLLAVALFVLRRRRK